MYKLTERRFEKAKPILDKYRKKLHDTGFMSAGSLEIELKKCWNVGYKELKPIFIALSKKIHYRYLVACYMESSCPIAKEFKSVLEKMYGIESHDSSPDRGSKRKAFWKKLNAKHQ